MPAGALFGAMGVLHGRPVLPLVPAVVILAVVCLAACVLARADAPWARSVVSR